MQRVLYSRIGLALAATSFLALGCGGSETSDGQVDTTAQSANAPAASGATTAAAPAEPAVADMRLEVDLNARRLHVFKGGQEVGTYPVAVGSQRWPTEKGEWTVKQVVWNPDWVPPDESWADEREPRESGDPKNPLGRAQLVYDLPRTIHGTNAPSSVGQAVSHGSIRMTNESIVQLAKQVMEAGGAGKDESWYTQTQQNRRQKQVVDLPRPVPIRVR
jgi:lipoprotein-anchoring transpeptidase ErfK/SrfK